MEVLPKIFSNKRILIGGCIVVFFLICAIFAPLIAPTSPNDLDISLRLVKPSLSAWFGFDNNGGNVLTSLVYGARISLFIAFLTVIISLFVGVFVGVISGYFGGYTDIALMRMVDIFMAFPGILLALALLSVMGPSIFSIIFAISITGWTSSARIARAQVLSIKEREHVSVSKALGASHPRIIYYHILPLIWAPLIVHATFSISGVIIIEASLSFLGLGAGDGVASWGSLLNQGKSVLEEAPHLSIFPGLAIAFVVLALNFIGDGLRDILDPKNSPN